jgi:XTP/dITP diphosphohydrolase
MEADVGAPRRGAGALVLLLATHNSKKLAEIERILRAELGAGVHLLGLDLHPEVATAPEEGATFAENARQKALWYAERTGAVCLADDSGLEVDALGGRPGVHSARYAGADASDADNRRKLLQELAGVAPPDRTARFRCAICLVDGSEVVFEADGTTEGSLLLAERGGGGFGYDPLFLSSELGSAELGQTFAEAPAAAKDRVSHRGRALARLAEFLNGTPVQT